MRLFGITVVVLFWACGDTRAQLVESLGAMEVHLSVDDVASRDPTGGSNPPVPAGMLAIPVATHLLRESATAPWHQEENVMGSGDEREDTTIYEVVVSDEEQYSIWPADRELPLGWQKAGKSGTKAECLAYIEEVWTDMRPLSLRKKMEEMERQKP